MEDEKHDQGIDELLWHLVFCRGYAEHHVQEVFAIRIAVMWINKGLSTVFFVRPCCDGWKFPHMKIRPNERLKYAKNILNIIKSPNNCINQEDKAKSNINTSIYISKCLLNENLQYKENNFFYLPIETSNIKFIKFLEND